LKKLYGLAALVTGFGVLLISCSLGAQTQQVFNTSDSRFNPSYDNHGWHSATRQRLYFPNYIVGSSFSHYFNNFFTFDLSTLNGIAVSATLEIRRFGSSNTNEAVETYELFDVTTDAATLNNTAGPSPSMFTDLGSGVSYGSFEVPGSGLPDDILIFPLNAAAINDINAAKGGFFSIGGTLTSNDGNDYITGSSDNTGIQRLVVMSVHPPTAVAGMDQRFNVGETVYLDGSASYDDNTAPASLLYSWSFSSVPAGSTAFLSDANTATPSFLADVGGTFMVQLIVADQDGLLSPPSEVVISSDINLAPIANAGADILSIIGDIVNFDGSGSTDPESDPMDFTWTITTAPQGSAASLTDSDSAFPSFIPVLEGTYEITLLVSDFLGPGSPDTVKVTATNAEQFAEIHVLIAANFIGALEPFEITNEGNSSALLEFLNQVVVALQSDNLMKAVKMLELSIERTDGCFLRGAPDGNGQGMDWIIDCAPQIEVYNLLNDALDALSG
jgi:hypothetical protein